MGWSRLKRDVYLAAVGKRRWATLLGIAVTAAYTLAVLLWGRSLALPETVTYAGGAVGGFVAGAALGTNPEDAFAYGVRAGALGMTLVSVVIGVGSLVLWFDASGQMFLLTSSVVWMLGFMLVPVYALVGGFSGSLGTFLRRTLLPSEYNPSAR